MLFLGKLSLLLLVLVDVDVLANWVVQERIHRMLFLVSSLLLQLLLLVGCVEEETEAWVAQALSAEELVAAVPQLCVAGRC
jgi:hypothetical protein